MPNTTTNTLAQMILSFDDPRVEHFYQNLIHENSQFKQEYVDRIVGILIKLDRLFKHHLELESFYYKLQEQRHAAESQYQDWASNAKHGQALDELIESDPDIKHLFVQLMDLGSSNKYLEKEGIDFLIQMEAMLDQKLEALHRKQISLDQEYITNTWHSHRRLARVIMDLAHRLPVHYEKKDRNVSEKGAEKVVFKLCEKFRGSFKPTPSGYHYIRLHDFIDFGVEQICVFLPTDQYQYVKSVASEMLSGLYSELEEFYSTFQGTQVQIEETIGKREENAEKLHEKLSQLKDLVTAYAGQLDRFSHAADQKETYADKLKVLRTPKPPPSLRRG